MANDELISRQVAQHKINALIDKFETIMKDIRERHVDDSVCGLCEYDGAFMSDSGSWCNECPGFERDDCFKLKDQYREEWAGAIKNLPPVQPRTGKWILCDNQNEEDVANGNYLYKCSECGRSDLHAKTQKVPHCWWCGAIMENDTINGSIDEQKYTTLS